MSEIFAYNLKVLRNQLGISQERLAEEISSNRPVIGSYEENRAEPSFTNLLRICAVLYTTPTEIISSKLKLTNKKSKHDKRNTQSKTVGYNRQ